MISHNQVRSSTASEEKKKVSQCHAVEKAESRDTGAVLQKSDCSWQWPVKAGTDSADPPGSGFSGSGCCLHEERSYAKQSWKQSRAGA